MITLLTFCKIYCLWITLYSYWIINVFVVAFAKKTKSEFIFYILCFIGGLILSLAVVKGLYLFDLFPPHFASSITPLETYDFSLEEQILNDNINEFEDQNKVDEDIRKKTYIWIITTLLVYVIVFSIKNTT